MLTILMDNEQLVKEITEKMCEARDAMKNAEALGRATARLCISGLSESLELMENACRRLLESSINSSELQSRILERDP